MLNGLPSRSIVNAVSDASIISPLISFPFFCRTRSRSLVLICFTVVQSLSDVVCCENASGAWLESSSKTSNRGRVLCFIMFSFSKVNMCKHCSYSFRLKFAPDPAATPQNFPTPGAKLLRLLGWRREEFLERRQSRQWL